VPRSGIGAHGRYRSVVALRRPEHPERVAFVAIIVLIAANVAIFGTRNEVRGTAAPERPTPLVQLSPQENELVLAQSSIIVDLRPTYTAQLSIDGNPIPDDQLSIQPDVFELSFQPNAEHDIHRFEPGTHTATVEYWPKTKTYEQAKAQRLLGSYTWNFNVS
jgi:hypothetical protein